MAYIRKGYRENTVTDKQGRVWPQCCGDSFNGWHSYQCGRAGKIEDEGDPTVHWCWQHDPTRAAMKENAKHAARRKEREAHEAKVRAAADVVKGINKMLGLDIKVRVFKPHWAKWDDLGSVSGYIVNDDDMKKLVKLLEGLRHEAPLEEAPSFDDVEAAGLDGTLRDM